MKKLQLIIDDSINITIQLDGERVCVSEPFDCQKHVIAKIIDDDGIIDFSPGKPVTVPPAASLASPHKRKKRDNSSWTDEKRKAMAERARARNRECSACPAKYPPGFLSEDGRCKHCFATNKLPRIVISDADHATIQNNDIVREWFEKLRPLLEEDNRAYHPYEFCNLLELDENKVEGACQDMVRRGFLIGSGTKPHFYRLAP